MSSREVYVYIVRVRCMVGICGDEIVAMVAEVFDFGAS